MMTSSSLAIIVLVIVDSKRDLSFSSSFTIVLIKFSVVLPIVSLKQISKPFVNWIFISNFSFQIQAWTVFDSKTWRIPTDGWRGWHSRWQWRWWWNGRNVWWQRTWITDVIRGAWKTAVETYRQIHESRVSMSIATLHNRYDGLHGLHYFIWHEMQHGNGKATTRTQSEFP